MGVASQGARGPTSNGKIHFSAERIFHAWDAPHTRDHPTAGSSTPDSRVEHCALLPLCQQPRSPPARTRLHTPLPRSPTCFLFLRCGNVSVRSIMGSIRALALLLGLSPWAAYACFDYTCFGVTMCNDGEFAGECAEPRECPSTAIQMATNGVVQIRGWRCRVTLEQIRLAFPDVLTKEDTEYTLNNKIWIRDGAILEIHGASKASSADTAVSLLKLKVCVPAHNRQLLVCLFVMFVAKVNLLVHRRSVFRSNGLALLP